MLDKVPQPSSREALDKLYDAEIALEEVRAEVEAEQKVAQTEETVRGKVRAVMAGLLPHQTPGERVYQDSRIRYIAAALVDKMGASTPEAMISILGGVMRHAQRMPGTTGDLVEDVFRYLRLRETGLRFR